MQLAINGNQDLDYTIEVSQDLLSWRPLVTKRPVGGILRFLDPDRTNSRFYRIAADQTTTAASRGTN